MKNTNVVLNAKGNTVLVIIAGAKFNFYYVLARRSYNVKVVLL